MNVLIIDDEHAVLNLLKETVVQICEKENIPINVRVEDDPVSVITDEKYKHSDVILLDIDMPDMSGIETASKINELKGKADKPYIIFVSNRDDLVFDALKEQPYSFVRKSHLEDLAACILKIQEKISVADVYSIKTGRGIDNLYINDIIYLEKKNNYVLFHTEAGVYKERTTIEAKYSDLSQYGFLRPQIGYLVNVRYIERIMKSTIILSTGEDIPLSKKYSKSIKQDFFEWMVNRR